MWKHPHTQRPSRAQVGHERRPLTPCAGHQRSLPRRPAASDVVKSFTLSFRPRHLPFLLSCASSHSSHSLAQLFFNLQKPRTEHPPLPSICASGPSPSNRPQPKLLHHRSFLPDSSLPSSSPPSPGIEVEQSRRPLFPPELHLDVELPRPVIIFFT